MKNVKLMHILDGIQNLIKYLIRLRLGHYLLLIQIIEQIAILRIIHDHIDLIILFQDCP